MDLCLGARRSIQFTDADFHLLDVETPITVAVTLGELDDDLKNLDAYGMYLRGFDAENRNDRRRTGEGCRDRAYGEAHRRQRSGADMDAGV